MSRSSRVAGVPALTVPRVGRLGTGAILGIVALFVTAAVLQVSVLTKIPLPGATPDLLLLSLIGVALARGSLAGTIAGFGAGMLLDLIPPADHAVGRYALVLCLAGYLVGSLGWRLVDNLFGLMALTAVVAALTFLGYAGLGVLIGDPRSTSSTVADLLPSVVLYNAALAPLVVRAVLGRYRRATRTDLGAIITARKARKLNPLARRQERLL